MSVLPEEFQRISVAFRYRRGASSGYQGVSGVLVDLRRSFKGASGASHRAQWMFQGRFRDRWGLRVVSRGMIDVAGSFRKIQGVSGAFQGFSGACIDSQSVLEAFQRVSDMFQGIT